MILLFAVASALCAAEQSVAPLSSVSSQDCPCTQMLDNALNEGISAACPKISSIATAACEAYGPIAVAACWAAGQAFCGFVNVADQTLDHDFAAKVCSLFPETGCRAAAPITYAPSYTGWEQYNCQGTIWGSDGQNGPLVQQGLNLSRCIYGGNLWGTSVMGICSSDGTTVVITQYNGESCQGKKIGTWDTVLSGKCYYDKSGKKANTLMGRGSAQYLCTASDAVSVVVTFSSFFIAALFSFILL